VRGFDGWSADAIALVERAIAAHGGLRQWRAITSIRLPFQNASGFLLWLKGYPQTFPAPREFEIRPHERTTILHSYPDERHRGHFADGNVSIEHVDNREVLVESKEHRRTFTRLAKYRRWSTLDALYFFGYALAATRFLSFGSRFVRAAQERRREMSEGRTDSFGVKSGVVATWCRNAEEV
jgi:hypothetical protein